MAGGGVGGVGGGRLGGLVWVAWGWWPLVGGRFVLVLGLGVLVCVVCHAVSYVMWRHSLLVFVCLLSLCLLLLLWCSVLLCAPAAGSRDPEQRRARTTRRPPVSECRDETTCLRPNVPTGHKVSPDPTRQKARHSKWNCSDHLNRRQPARNVRRTDAQPKATAARQPRAHHSEHH